MSSWSLESIPWETFDRTKVDPVLLAQAKGASLVESNAADYVTYLRTVFADNPAVLNDIEEWGKEEELHGAVLRKWCEMADPEFDYSAALKRFQNVYQLPVVSESVRGSASKELVARCVVETGTTTFYTALRDLAEEPVFKEICRRIAGDEVRHFNLFLRHLTGHYAEKENLGFVERAKTVFERVLEVDDPELTFAYYVANLGEKFDPDQFPAYSKTYISEAFGLYKQRHFNISVPMIAKAIGLKIPLQISRFIGRAVYLIFRFRYVRLSQPQRLVAEI